MWVGGAWGGSQPPFRPIGTTRPCPPPGACLMPGIAPRLAGIRDRIAVAARSAGRDPASVRLVAGPKTVPLEGIPAAYAAGQRDFGENRVQEVLQKITSGTDLEIRWHLLGHLQTNKARKAPAFATIHSVDTVELLRKIDAAAAEAGKTPD